MRLHRRIRDIRLSRSRTLWLVAWGAVFAILLFLLPTKPDFHLETPGRLEIHGFADNRTLVLKSLRPHGVGGRSYIESLPLVVVDLPTGSMRTIDLPAGFGRPEAATGTETKPVRQIGGEEGARRWNLTGCHVAGDDLVVEMSAGTGILDGDVVGRTLTGGGSMLVDLSRKPGIPRWLHIWNWRTGEAVLHRAIDGRASGVVGSRFWVQTADPTDPERQIEFFDVPTGQSVDAPVDYMHLTNFAPDGSVVAQPGPEAVTFWRLDRSRRADDRPLLTIPPWTQFAFSPDSRHIGTLDYWEQSKEGSPDERRRTWRIFDAATGSQIAEKVETGRLSGGVENPLAITFPDGGSLAAHGPQKKTAGLLMHGIECGPISLWRWRTSAEIRLIDGLLSRVTRTFSSSELDLPRAVIDSSTLVDVATGEPLATLPPGLQMMACSSPPRWGVVQGATPGFRQKVADIVARISPSAAERISRPYEPRLFDVARGRPTAPLGENRHSFWFSPDNRWLVTQDAGTLEIWRLPPRLRLLDALLRSLPVPLLAIVFTSIRRRRSTTLPGPPGPVITGQAG